MLTMIKNFEEKDVNQLKTIIIAVHGFSSSKNSFINRQIAPLLRENNIGMVCFDLPGHGDRKNELLKVDTCLNSIKEIEDYVRSIYHGPISLTGKSFGGFLLLRYLENNQIKYFKTILMAPALEQYKIGRHNEDEEGKDLILSLENGKNFIREGMEVDVSVLKDFFKFDIFNHLDIENDVKLIYGTKDVTVSNENIKKMANLKNWELFSVDGADHFYRRDEDVKTILNLFLKIINAV